MKSFRTGLLAAAAIVAVLPAIAQARPVEWDGSERQAGPRDTGRSAPARDYAPQRQVQSPPQPPAPPPAPMADTGSQRAQWQGNRGQWERGNRSTSQPAAQPGQSGGDRSQWTRGGDAGQWRRDGGQAQPGSDAGNDRRRTDSQWNRGNGNRDNDRQADRGNRNDGQWNRDGRTDRNQWNRNDRNGNDRHWDNNDRRGDNRQWNGNRYGRYDNRPNLNWRNDHRYDWRNYRDNHRDVFRRGRYHPPRGYSYGYRSVYRGFFLEPFFYASSYWLADPYQYRLPPVEWPYRWVRYYDDALLVDTTTGEVADVIENFFY